ncbi:MAG: histidine kinase, partial [Lachnospiraceae bacterium]|nr:histidine kinase [Lachnospiraceae bacterium]
MFVIAVVFSANLGLKEVVLILLVTFVMKYYNGKSFKKNIVLMIIYQSIVLVVDYVAVVLAVDYILGVDMTSYFVQSLLVVLAKLFLFLVIMLITTLFAKKDMKHFSDEIWLKFLFFPMFTLCIIVALLSNSSFMLEKQQQELYWIIAFGLVGMNIVVFYLVNDVALIQKKIHEKEMFEIQATTQMQLYETILADTERQRKMSHEYKNQMECIQTLFETKKYEDLREYLQKITGRVLQDIDFINTNHAMVNAVLNVKYLEAMEKGIVIVYKINDMSKLQMDSQDIVLLLSNLLNNAIEACEK